MNGLEHAVKWDYHHQEGHDIEAAVPAEGDFGVVGTKSSVSVHRNDLESTLI